MSNAVVPKWHGNNYQARVFWENVINLLDSTSAVVEVTFEADGPKAFDDVVVKYDPSRPSSGSERVSADYHQVKWHVEYGGRFGYKDFINPSFIGATSMSLLQRLQQAKKSIEPGACFNFITVYRIADGDQLAELIAGTDKSLLVEKLFDKTVTDKSRMGEVRKLWREHLQLSSDDELREIVAGFRIFEGHRSLEEMRTQINLRAQVVGLLTCKENSDFRYDELARQLKARKINKLTKEIFEKFCREEGLMVDRPSNNDPFLKIAIRSFLGLAADNTGATEQNTLLLTDSFRQRYLKDELNWQEDIQPKIKEFLIASVLKSRQLRLILDAHASIAFFAGSVLDFKSGVEVELVQKGRIGSRTWRADDGSVKKDFSSKFVVTEESIGKGSEVAIAISISQDAERQTKDYVALNLPNVGTLVTFYFSDGPGQQNISGGEHAAVLAEQVSNTLRNLRIEGSDAVIHIFAACPNAFLFFLGQHHEGIEPCIIYEFDFNRSGNKTYQPSFLINGA